MDHPDEHAGAGIDAEGCDVIWFEIDHVNEAATRLHRYGSRIVTRGE
jgi:hypothetical protein